MANLDIQQLRRQFGAVVAVDSVDLSSWLRGAAVAARAERLREDDGAPHHRRLRSARPRRRPGRRQEHHRRPGEPPQHGDGLPGLQPVPDDDRAPERRVRPAGPWRGQGGSRPQGHRDALPGPARTPGRSVTRISCPAASSSESRWPGRWPWNRRYCCSTSRCPRWTPRSGSSCARRSGRSSHGSGSRRSTSRTTRRRPSRSPTGSQSCRPGGSSRSDGPRRSTGARRTCSWPSSSAP